MISSLRETWDKVGLFVTVKKKKPKTKWYMRPRTKKYTPKAPELLYLEV